MMEIPFAQGSDFVELAFPLGADAHRFDNAEIEFKWFDHLPEPLDVLDFQDHGDTAPNNRFRYACTLSPRPAGNLAEAAREPGLPQQ